MGTEVLLAANSIFHLCTNTTNEDQPMVSKFFHIRFAIFLSRLLYTAHVCSLVDKILFVFCGRLRLLCYFSAKLGEQSQTEVAAMRPNASVRILRAAGFECCAVGPTSTSAHLQKTLECHPLNCAGLYCGHIPQILANYAETKTLPNA